jgi:outer membrane receptor for monomeric catechols
MTNAANLLYYRAYVNDGPKAWNIAPTNDSVYTWEFYRRDQSRQKQTLDSVQLSTVAGFWRGRITYVGGVRRDSYESKPENVGVRDAKGRVATFVQGVPLNISVTKFSSGGTFFPIEQAGVYANYSESFNPVGNGANGIKNEVFGPTQGSGTSYGLRFKLFSDRLTGSFGYYDSEEANRVAGGTNTEINRLWTNLGKAERVLPAFRDTNDQRAKGYELDVVLNVSRDFRFRGGLAFPKATQSNTLPGLRAYYAEHIKEWRAAAADPNTTALAQVVADIAALDLRLGNAAEGRQLNGRPDYTANFFGNYTIPSGMFKRVSVGFGTTFVGKAIIGNLPNQPFDYLKASARYVAQGSVGYRFRAWNHNVNAQLNVSNLFDHDDPVFNGTATRAATATSASQVLRSGFYFIEPRKYALTLSVDL